MSLYFAIKIFYLLITNNLTCFKVRYCILLGRPYFSFAAHCPQFFRAHTHEIH